MNDKRCSGRDLRERHCPDNEDSARFTVCDSDEASNMENSPRGLLLSSPISDLLHPYSLLKSSPPVKGLKALPEDLLIERGLSTGVAL